MSETKIRIQPNKGGAKAINLNRGEIENAISIAGTMKQAALYLNVSYNTFRRECMKYDNLWNPQPAGGKGKKRVTKHYINQSLLYKILRGENINSWRETVLMKRALLEKYLTAKSASLSIFCIDFFEYAGVFLISFSTGASTDSSTFFFISLLSASLGLSAGPIDKPIVVCVPVKGFERFIL